MPRSRVHGPAPAPGASARGPLIAAVMGLVSATGCHGCRDDHPYVPYAIGSASHAGDPLPDASGAATASPVALSEGGAPLAGEPATTAPPGLTRWTLQGLTLDAPDGLVFASAVVRDFDGDGAADAVALVRPGDGNDPGQVAFYRGPTPGLPTLVAPPTDLARDPSCAPIDRLELIGKRSLLAELGAECPMHPSSAPVRWAAVLSAGTPATVRLAVTIADPPGAPALSVDADTSDHDADGLEDLALRVTLEGGGPPLEPGPRVTAAVAWLDRPAGLSRDTTVTEASFASLASTAAVRAVRAKEAPTVPGYVGQMRTLWRAMCAEGGAPRIVGVAGTGAMTCGVARALETAGLAEVRAYATMGDPLRAALALDRAQRPPAARTAARVAEAQGWIAQGAPLALARSMRAVSALPVEGHGHEPAWGALAFETSGKLLVRTAAGVVRVDPDQGDEAAADGEWKAGVTSPDGALRWIEAYDPCDGLPLRATFTTGDDVRDIALPVLPPLGGRCSGSRGAPARTIPVAWGPGGLEAIVEGALILIASNLANASPLASFLDQPPVRGAPRSPDGKTYVVPTEAGLLVRSATRARLLRAKELDGAYGDQRACVVTDDATHVACIHANHAWVGAWD